MNGTAYTRFELLRTFRNRRFLLFSLGFPLVLFVFIALPGRNEHDFGGSGIDLPLYFMVGLTSFGTMMAMVSSGARIANERQTGWTRQLRITPLTTRAYFRAKVLTAYAMACTTIALLFVAGVAIGVRMPADEFAALGVLLGHVITVDSIGPATGGIVSLLAIVSGTWFPVPDRGLLHDVAQMLPSYWLNQASHVSLGGGGWSTTGWIVVAGWTVLLARLARYAYRRDTQRV